MTSGEGLFTSDDLYELSSTVAEAWTTGTDRDWSVQAGTVEWSCTKTADHAVDTVFAPACMLASRRQDAYPDIGGGDWIAGPDVRPDQLVRRLAVATRILAAVVADASPNVRAVIRRRPEITIAPPQDFLPRGGLELILHAHDVCAGLGVPFEPPTTLCRHLREHTRPWPTWGTSWDALPATSDPWGDLLAASRRHRQGT